MKHLRTPRIFKLIALILCFNCFVLNDFKANGLSNSVNALSLSNAEALFRQGKALYYRDNYESAIKIWLQALVIYQNNNPLKESEILSNISFAYLGLKNAPEALKYAEQAVQKSEGVHPDAQSFALFALGEAYNSYERYPDAVRAYQKALSITQKTNDPKTRAQILIGLGEAYRSWAQYAQAIKVFEEVEAWAKATHNARIEEQARMHLAYLHFMVSRIEHRNSEFDESFKQCEIKGARNYANYRKRAECFRVLGAKGQEMSAQIDAASICFDSGDNDCALDSFSRALIISQEIGVAEREARILQQLAILFNRKNKPELAIVFLKKAVSIYESIRAKSLPPELQNVYAQQVEQSYRDLADLLLQQDRVLEAQQVLDLLKVQELDTYLRNVRGETQPLTVLHPEAEILKQYGELQKTAIQTSQDLAQLRKRATERKLSSLEEKRLATLDQLETALNKQFQQFKDRPEIQKLVAQLSREVQAQSINLSDLEALRDDLRRLNAVMVYPLILEDRLEIVITTPDAPPLHRTVNVKRADLNAAIVEFRRALQTPGSDAKAPAQRLYTWLIKPLEADLRQVTPKTIIYAPDGQLRYIPLAALYDGEHWLVQRYRTNNITAKSLTKFNQPVNAPMRILAGAFADVNTTYPITVGKQTFSFKGLPAARLEVTALTTAFPGTAQYLDRAFALASFKPRMNGFSVVHLATHAAFMPGDPSFSFILFGDGSIATLRDIENWSLSNVDLVVLSACDTGVGIKAYGEKALGNGEEILGLGYQFQNRGARATIASLWSVDDGGTESLMSTFYIALKQENMTKAEALQRAQISMIERRPLSNEKINLRSSVSYPPSSGQTAAISRDTSHPYYWAPFILIGNGL